jgi:hypothetical protein
LQGSDNPAVRSRRWIALLAAAGLAQGVEAQEFPRYLLLAADGGANQNFGVAVALSERYAVVGAPGAVSPGSESTGAAYVYSFDGSRWIQEAKLVAPDSGFRSSFGAATAADGERVVVGAPNEIVDGLPSRGAVYVFARTNDVWTQQARLLPERVDRDQYFGAAVAMSGDTIAVGVPGDFVNTNVNQGSVQVFVRSGTAWVRQAQVISADGADADRFGSAVSLDGDTLAAGAAGNDNERGAAYAFLRSGTGWLQQAKLSAPVGQPEDRFGEGIAVSGNSIVVGAPYVDVGNAMDAGAAYVFVRAGGLWSLQAQLSANDRAAEDYFGGAVAALGESALVGAIGDDIGVFEDLGSAYLYRRNGSAWTVESKLSPPSGSFDNAGVSVALSSRARLLGAWQSRAGGAPGQGAAYAFGPVPAAAPAPVPGLGGTASALLAVMIAIFAGFYSALRRQGT